MNHPAGPGAIAERIEAVFERIDAACARAGRRRDDVTVIAVSKTWDAPHVVAAAQAGVQHLGENRVQEALAKMSEMTNDGCALSWHLIGHLQTNKVRAAVGRFAILHAVDSERLCRGIDRSALEPQPIMIEVNVSGEATKFGVEPGNLPALVEVARSLPNVSLEGLMTVAPRSSNPEGSRRYFAQLRQLAETNGLPALSMGMTGDFEVAIEEGATHVRVGRAIFGDRE